MAHMSSLKPVHTIVLDTGPIVLNSPAISTLVSKSESIATTPSVTSEIKDENSRTLFENTLRPFLDIQTPSLLSIKFVTDFARKTGDLAVLSRTDIEVIALTYELDCRRNHGDSRLRKSPGQKPSSATLQNALENSVLMPQKSEPAKVLEPSPVAPWATRAIPQPDLNDGKEVPQPDSPAKYSAAEPIEEVVEPFNELSVGDAHQKPNTVVDNDVEPPPKECHSTAEIDDSISDDSDGWITPSNIRKVQAAEQNPSASAMSTDATMEVAVITSDFAMQNLILQIGLNLLSPKLQRIRNIRTYVLRCHACFQIVKDTSKQFCSRCGKPTLTRVSSSVNAKGEFKIHLKKNMQWNHRGDRYSVPKAVSGQANGKVGKGKGGGKGGWGQELILAEDQKEYQRAMDSNRRKKEIDPLDQDYMPGILTGDRDRGGGRQKVGAGRNVNSKRRA